jgi:hypothetical protein
LEELTTWTHAQTSPMFSRDIEYCNGSVAASHPITGQQGHSEGIPNSCYELHSCKKESSGYGPEDGRNPATKCDSSHLQIIGSEVLTAVVMNVAIFWDMAPCSSYVNRRFGRTYHLHLQDKKQPTKNHPSAGRSTLYMGLIRSSETSVYIRITRRYIPEDGNIRLQIIC